MLDFHLRDMQFLGPLHLLWSLALTPGGGGSAGHSSVRVVDGEGSLLLPPGEGTQGSKATSFQETPMSSGCG